MAELVLSTVGSAVGSAIGGPVGGAIGRTLGAVGGRAIDQRIFGETRRVEGPRIAEFALQGSSEDAGVPIVYGRMRIAGQVIWAARPREYRQTEDAGGGGKGGGGSGSATVTTYRYTMSFAVALCEGEVSRVERAWANGAPLDLSKVAWRFYPGTEDQAPDPVIEAVEGVDAAPAYRGTAYVVFEDLPLDSFGNAVPNLAFEIVTRPRAASAAPRLEEMAQGVCLIPGAGEFTYATAPVRRRSGFGATTPENQHTDAVRPDVLVSLDQLAQDLPYVRSVMIVVGWFGDDLRAGACQVRPGVDRTQKATHPMIWSVDGVSRAGAHRVSEVNGAAAYGGTPSDDSVLELITEIKRRGWRVSLYPFLFMDIPGEANLPDPSGSGMQPAYPWRGRIRPAAAGNAAAEIAAFFGGGSWSYRRFILHYAQLAAQAGGVDAFVIGSELKALTTAQDASGGFPAVAELQRLAGDARAIVGPGVKLTYAADWSEYFGHQPTDGSGDVYFHLDPLWADDSIDAVGVDWYPPLTDWRDGDGHLDAAVAASPYDPAYHDARVAGGEAFDWFYASAEDRAAQRRTPITDGAYGKPWVYRAKDLVNWWANAHVERRSGVEIGAATAWIPRSKPIWLIELGAPAIDKGGNAPNAFPDAKSAEGVRPPFSNGARDDAAQRAALEAHLRRAAVEGPLNPRSPAYGGLMIDPTYTHLWAWDARPFPAFPALSSIWADGPNWALGHWLNGRAGLAQLGDVIADLCARGGLGAPDVSAVDGALPGFVVDAPTTPRAALADLLAAFGVRCVERAGRLIFSNRAGPVQGPLRTDDLALDIGDGAAQIVREDVEAAPALARVTYLDPAREYLRAVAQAREGKPGDRGALDAVAPAALAVETAQALAAGMLARARARQRTAQVSVSPAWLALEPGDRISLDLPGASGVYEVAATLDGRARTLTLIPATAAAAPAVSAPAAHAPPALAWPELVIVDPEPAPGEEEDQRPLAAVAAAPWVGPVEIWAGPDAASARLRGRATAPACVGELTQDLSAGFAHRWDDADSVRAVFATPPPPSAPRSAVLDGANRFAVLGADGAWQLLQAAVIETGDDGVTTLRSLLRGGASGMTGPAASGAPIVALDGRAPRLEVAPEEAGAPLSWFAVPPGARPSDSDAVRLAWGRRAAIPFAPVWLRAAWQPDGSIAASWIRRTRIGGDSWASAEVPLGEDLERYEAALFHDGALLQRIDTTTPGCVFAPAPPQGALLLQVRQWSARAGYGARAESIVRL